MYSWTACTDGENGTARLGLAQRRQRPRRCVGTLDDDGGQGLAEGRLDGLLPAIVDLDDVEQCAQDALHLGQPLGAGAGVGCVERELQRFDAGDGPRGGLGRGRPLPRRPLERGVGLDPCLLRGLDLLDERRLDLLGLRAIGPQATGLAFELFELGAQLIGARRRPALIALAALQTASNRTQLTAHLGGCARRLRSAVVGGQRFVDALALGLEIGLFGLERFAVGGDLFQRDPDLFELGRERRDIGLEVGDDARVHQLALIAFERTLPLGEDPREAASPLAELLDLPQALADIARAARRQLCLERHDLGVELGEARLQLALGAHGLDAAGRDRLELGPQAGDLASRHEHPERLELLHQRLVPPSRLRLALERAELTAHLAQQVLKAKQVGLGRVEAPFGLLLALAVLEDARRLLDDAAPILRTGVEHRVDLSLADDDVLLTAHAGIGQQLLDVEEAAADTVDRVLAVAVAEQHAGDRDLVELHRQQPRRVVEREADLRSPERRTLLGTGEDDVVHLL